MARFSPVVWLSLCAAVPASAEVTFSQGIWRASMETCADQVAPAGAFCGGLEVDDPSNVCSANTSTYRTSVTSAANYPGSAGGSGFRMYLGDTHNAMSTSMVARFATPEPEVWVRYYTRYAQGQTWGSIVEHKMIYVFTDSSVAVNVNFPQGAHDLAIQPRNTMGNPDLFITGWGWDDLYPGGTGDGSWHLYEHHLSLGQVGQNDGTYQFWVDGVNRVDRRDLDFFNGGQASPTGFTRLVFPHNHNVSTVPGCTPVDIDDVAVARPDFSGFVQDAQGRTMLGGLSATDAGTTIPDAGPAADAGTSQDAGTPDAGTDAGVTQDAGSIVPDGGAPSPDCTASDTCAAGGCSCTSVPSGVLAFALIVIAAARRARPRR